MSSFPVHLVRNLRNEASFGQAEMVIATIVALQNVDTDWTGYTEEYQGVNPIIYIAAMNYGGKWINDVEIGWSAWPRHKPPVRVQALRESTIILGVKMHEQLFWLFQELPAVGCKP